MDFLLAALAGRQSRDAARTAAAESTRSAADRREFDALQCELMLG
jgi:hypothetical protein